MTPAGAEAPPWVDLPKVLCVRKRTVGMAHEIFVFGLQSVWFPMPTEIERIKQGAPIYLTVLGQIHPPVAMEVGPEPDLTA